jgi:uncharacterized membrane protein HdeD (DUF308 family)
VNRRHVGAPLSAKWAWTFFSGCLTLLLAIVAFFLPDIDVAPRSGLVGWLLVLAGLPELIFGWKRGLDEIGKAAVGSGIMTTAAGLIFVSNPVLGYFPVMNIVIAWLFLRGAWVLAMALRARSYHLGPWMALSGAADILLGFALLVGVQISTLVVLLFGPTPQVVAKFAMILATSFFFTGIAQVAIGLLQRQRSRLAV